jgi:hypothetical protein
MSVRAVVVGAAEAVCTRNAQQTGIALSCHQIRDVLAGTTFGQDFDDVA